MCKLRLRVLRTCWVWAWVELLVQVLNPSVSSSGRLRSFNVRNHHDKSRLHNNKGVRTIPCALRKSCSGNTLLHTLGHSLKNSMAAHLPQEDFNNRHLECLRACHLVRFHVAQCSIKGTNEVHRTMAHPSLKHSNSCR